MSLFKELGKKANYKKVVVAVAFGLISYFVGTLPLKMQLTNNNSIPILVGIILPLFIAAAWGWRYGLIALLFGGIQSVWFSGLNQGYALLYTVFMYTAWIMWHGVFSELRNKNADDKKWYRNIYTVELVFRIIFETVYLFAFPYLASMNPAAWQPNTTMTLVSTKWLFFNMFTRLLSGYLLILTFRMIFRFTSMKKTVGVNGQKHQGKNIVHISLLFAIVVIFIEAVGTTYFVTNRYGSVMENFLSFEYSQLFTRGLFIISFLSFGFALQYYFNKSENATLDLKESNTALKRHEEDINHVLQLASDIGKAEKVDPVNFLSNLLMAAINIIPEADYGFTFRYQHGEKIIISQKGHDDALIGTRINLSLNTHAKNEIILADNIKGHLLNQIVGSDYFKIRENLKNANESMMILCEHEDKVIAGMILGVNPATDKRFSAQSLKIAGFLKDISVAFYNYLHLAEEREDTYKDIIMSSLKILSLHNAYTKDHSTGVANLSREIALCMDFNYKEAETIYWAGLVHDIGKILISDDILDKGGKLTTEEFEIIKKHSTLGYETFRESRNLTDISKYIYHHHEKWDGSGYPYGLEKTNIPLPSRILSVADVFDALTHDRPYRKAIPADAALSYIKENAGVQFDPKICDVFLQNFDSIFKKYNAS